MIDLNNETHYKLAQLFKNWAGVMPDELIPLPQSGSHRTYFRLKKGEETAIGVFNPNHPENIAFVTFTRHFLSKGLPVPFIYAEDLQNDVYLLRDLGDRSLYDLLQQRKAHERFSDHLKSLYKKVINTLIQFQIEGGKDLDYSVCHPRANFDAQSMVWDLNHFKYYFLNLAGIPYNEQYLQDDFNSLANYLSGADSNYFMYRDFQARNIMLINDEPWFIDYQGGRRGPLQYDLVSLLFQAKAEIPDREKEELLAHYLEQVQKHIAVDKATFKEYYYGFALIRTLQVLGAYGLRGFYERKPHFLQSIPPALANLEWLLNNTSIPVELPLLREILGQVIRKKDLKDPGKKTLKVIINSFSFKRGMPYDNTGHGGGFVFDCRALPNPGRYEEYAHLTGKDDAVRRYLEQYSEVEAFITSVFNLIGQSINRYMERGFEYLTVNFGCTGGQHRSVYCAEKMAAILQKHYEVDIQIEHKEMHFHIKD